jgi:DNA anti-recombination protein RmuC
VIDAKVSLNSYQDAFGAVDEASEPCISTPMPRLSRRM